MTRPPLLHRLGSSDRNAGVKQCVIRQLQRQGSRLGKIRTNSHTAVLGDTHHAKRFGKLLEPRFWSDAIELGDDGVAPYARAPAVVHQEVGVERGNWGVWGLLVQETVEEGGALTQVNKADSKIVNRFQLPKSLDTGENERLKGCDKVHIGDASPRFVPMGNLSAAVLDGKVDRLETSIPWIFLPSHQVDKELLTDSASI